MLTKRADEANKTKSAKLSKLPRAECALQAAMDARNLHWVPPPDWEECEQHDIERVIVSLQHSDIERVIVSLQHSDMERVDKGLNSMNLKVQRHPLKAKYYHSWLVKKEIRLDGGVGERRKWSRWGGGAGSKLENSQGGPGPP